MTTELVGRALGDALAEALGLEPVAYVPAYSPYKRWVFPWENVPSPSDALLTWAGVGLIVPAMAERGYSFSLVIGPRVAVAEFEKYADEKCWNNAMNEHPPTAVAQAALAALKGEG